jgi:hypothetical protein
MTGRSSWTVGGLTGLALTLVGSVGARVAHRLDASLQRLHQVHGLGGRGGLLLPNDERLAGLAPKELEDPIAVGVPVAAWIPLALQGLDELAS